VAGANRPWHWPFRLRGWRRESAVAQLSTVGVSMRKCFMKRLLGLLVVATFVLLVSQGCATPPTSSKHVHRIQVESSEIPFSKQLQMQQGDAYDFQLPNGKSVAVWCERPAYPMMLAEQTTKSGLRTAWGERPFKRPKPLMEQIGPNSYTIAGWKSYIVQGAVTTEGARTTEYELFVGNLRFSIIEDLTATSSLPVTIKVTRHG
jgi:hypothetical protein